jgi:hypothetical protein
MQRILASRLGTEEYGVTKLPNQFRPPPGI